MKNQSVFVPARLTTARQRRGLRMGELADLVGISSRSLSMYEGGTREPTPENLKRLADTLGFDEPFFLTPAGPAATPENASFRATTSLAARDRDSALATMMLAADIWRAVASEFDTPAVSIPDLGTLAPELAARALRAEWGLGDGPAPQMVDLVEGHGVRVFSLGDMGLALDAFATWQDGAPYIFLENNGKSPEHGRFDVAHELGHLVLHRSTRPQGRDAEHEANRFASEFLMPSSSVAADVKEAIPVYDLDLVLPLKAQWRVSVGAFVKKLHTIGHITEWQYRDSFIELTARGWRKAEPSPRLQSSETSSVLASVFSSLAADRRTMDFVRAVGVPYADINELVGGILPAVVSGAAPASSTESQPPSKPTGRWLRLVR